MNYYLRICSIVIVTFIISLTFQSAFAVGELNNSQDPDQDAQSSILQKIYLFMRAGNMVHPESPDGEEVPKSISCPSNSEPMFPNLPFNRPRVYSWVSLPTIFESNKINTPVKLGNRVLFRLHFTATEDENLEDIRFKFTLLHNGASIAQTDSARFNNLPSGEDGLVTISAGINVTGGLQVGDTLGIKFDYYVTGEGLAIKYDNPLYDSGMEMEMNAIRINEIRPDTKHGKHVDVYYTEAFNVNLNKLMFITRIDDIPIEEPPSFKFSSEGKYAHFSTKMKKGTHIVSVSISYGSNANETMVSLSEEVEIKIVEPTIILGITVETWTKIIAAIIIIGIIAGVAKYIKNKRAEREFLESLEY